MKTLILFLLLTSPALAADREAQDILERCEAALQGKPQWDWNVVRVRTILELGITVPLLSTLSINPEIELFFTKK